MTKVKVCFYNWLDPNYPDFHRDNIFLYILRKKYEVIIDNENPDLLFYTLTTDNLSQYKNCAKIFFTQEPVIYHKKDFKKYYEPHDRFYISIENCDYMLNPYYLEGEEYFRFPLYLLYAYQMILDGRLKNFNQLTEVKNYTKKDIEDKKFCVFMHRNSQTWHKRLEFMNKLSKYKNIDNISIEGQSFEKCEIIKNYKFAFAFENNDGRLPSCGIILDWNNWIYFGDENTSEKILEPLVSKTIPLYWGYNKIHEEFNNKSFINWYDYNDDEKMIEKIIELDNNTELYLEMLNQPSILDLSKSQFNFDEVLEFFEKIVNRILNNYLIKN